MAKSRLDLRQPACSSEPPPSRHSGEDVISFSAADEEADDEEADDEEADDEDADDRVDVVDEQSPSEPLPSCHFRRSSSDCRSRLA